MRDVYRGEQVEEGRHNLILQNRCGNRLTVLCHEEGVELEFVYKPNAYRRKEFRARNFSNRDNFTTLFAHAGLPEMEADFVERFSYDPFVCIIETRTPAGARNRISFLNVADENVFGIAARCPLLLTFRPHVQFAAEDGLLYEAFRDRGEEVVTFVAFDGFERNRYRVLADGRHVLQIMDDELLLIGGEENLYQVERVLERVGGFSVGELIQRTEELVRPVLSTAWFQIEDERFQRVADLNRRIIHSGLDEGGACFGALNRIYHLIWFRDGALAASQMARAGNPEMITTWAPFAVHNPSRAGDGDPAAGPEYLQMVGTPWSKREDDGLFYAVLSAFSAYRATADPAYVRAAFLEPLLDATDHHVATRWDDQLRMFSSDTVGETTLRSSEHFGYDSVDGSMRTDDLHVTAGREMARSRSLYHNVNMYNVFRMLEVLIAASREVEDDAALPLRERARGLEDAIRRGFIQEENGVFLANYVEFADGTREWLTFEDGDQWEYAWAVSVGPFFPCPDSAVRSARMVRETWPQVGAYGYCPWNSVAGMLREFGLSTDEFFAMLEDEVEEALMPTEKYPMQGALTERHGSPEGWRALPFSAGTFLNAVCSLILRGLPMGVAARASDRVTRLEGYVFGASRLHVTSAGQGDVVQSVEVNGARVRGSLQLPEALLRSGANTVRIHRGAYEGGPRLFSSDARLFAVRAEDEGFVYEMCSPTRAALIFEELPDGAELAVTDGEGEPLEVERGQLEGTGKEVVTVRASGDFVVRVSA